MEKKLSILILTNYYPPHYEGGYELSCQETADFLISQGHDVYIITGIKGEENPLSELPEPASGEVIRIYRYIDYKNGGMWNKHCVERFNYRITKTALQMVKPDIVYIWNMKSVSIAPVIAVQKSHYPYIFEIGDIWLSSYLAPSLKGTFFRWLKRVLPFTIGGKIYLNPVITISHWLAKELKDKYGSKDVFVVPRGVEIPEKIIKDKPHCPMRFLYMGRIEPKKGLHLCLEALGIITNQQPDFNFIFNVYGEPDPEYLRYCFSIVNRYRLKEKVFFYPKTSTPAEVYAKHDVLLFPTLAKEAFGRVVIEAMANGLIVIATNAYGPAEIITHTKNGFLFSSDNVNDLSEKILLVSNLSHQNFISITDQAIDGIKKGYELSLVKKQIADILVSYAILNKKKNIEV